MAKKKQDLPGIRSSAAEYLAFMAATGDSQTSMEMRYEEENIWLTKKLMAGLYDVDVRTINEHLKSIFADRELMEDEVTVRNFRIVQTEGQREVAGNTKHYNLQAIIAVGFKVNNPRAVQFRKWAGQIVKGYTIQGWTMDVERLKKGHMFTDEYFEGFLELNGDEILIGPGKISHEQFKLHAETEFEKYRIVQDRLYESDFGRWLKQLGPDSGSDGNE